MNRKDPFKSYVVEKNLECKKIHSEQSNITSYRHHLRSTDPP